MSFVKWFELCLILSNFACVFPLVVFGFRARKLDGKPEWSSKEILVAILILLGSIGLPVSRFIMWL